MRKTLQELGIHKYFYFERGEYNTITDAPGVKVGQCTIIEGQNIRTGVTVVIPPVDFSKNKPTAGAFAFNANGEVTSLNYILEESRLLSPIFLTNTFSVGDVFSSVLDYYKGSISVPVVAECGDGYLNDIEGRHVKKEHVVAAIENAKTGKIEQGNVGAGTGMRAFGFKAGIGTASRIFTFPDNPKKYTVGVLVNNNMNQGGRHRYLRIGGIDVGKILPDENIDNQKETPVGIQSSCVIIIALDVPLDHHQLNRVAKRAILGLGRIGAVSDSGSGDFVIAFTTTNLQPKRGLGQNYKIEITEESLLDSIFEATVEATEEALLNSLLTAEDMVGRDRHKMKAIPIDEIMQKEKLR